MRKQLLHQNWIVRPVGNLDLVPEAIRREIPATVPGCVHTDLLAAGLINDPYLDRNETKTDWIGRTDWEYACEFDADAELLAHERIDLVCEGLDTIAQVFANGALAGEASDMHLSYRFNLRPHIRAGKNRLAIQFSAPLVYAEKMEAERGPLPHVEKHPFNYIRKMACNFGWDWGPALVTSGIWKPIFVHAWSGVRIKAVRQFTSHLKNDSATSALLVDLEEAKPGNSARFATRIVSRISAPDGTASAHEMDSSDSVQTILIVDIENPQLWWPRGHGEQPLYSLEVQLNVSDGREIDRWSGRFGLRTVKLNTDKDEIGSKFQIEINGKPIFCKGANWIPDDCFLNRVTLDRYRQRIMQAVDSNMNMLRIWGGGIYETDDFYSICDELGVMVWQDFLFACAAYPEEEPFRSLVQQEVEQNVTRLNLHPSLVLLNGCNENVWGYFDWGWKEKIGERTWGLGYYTKLLPDTIDGTIGDTEFLMPNAAYWPASPWSGSMDIHPLDDNHGNKHVWDAWNRKDYTVYRDYTPRFVSEFGHQAPPTYATLRRTIPATKLAVDSPSMLAHQKAPGGMDKLHSRLLEHFEMPGNLNDWLYVTQLNQARAMQCGVEWFRSRAPVCMGALYWQLNDCWPVVSWAAVDGDGRPKPLRFATRRFFADRIVTIQPNGNSLSAFAINDFDAEWRGEISIRRMNFAGAVLASQKQGLTAAPRENAVVQINDDVAKPGDATNEFLVVEFGGERNFWFFEIDKNLRYPQPEFSTDFTVSGAGFKLNVTAKTVLRDLALFADRLHPDATVNDQLVTLLPGDSFTFEVRAPREFPLAAVINPPVMQCANRFGRKN